ncbi:MAG TPA: GNAT family N-acetyltransferase [Anaerolineales bacterium]|nr:GNAT family N-acetyltransferase [Anaerolineales bacterium]
MSVKDIRLLTAEPPLHFAAIAALISSQETEPSTQQTLTEWYTRQREDGIIFTAAVDVDGQVVGFNGIYRDNLNLVQHYGVYLIVDPGLRGKGLGSRLYKDLLHHAAELNAKTLKVRVRDNCDEGIHFAIQHGFVEKKHSIEMKFDLKCWDESRYATILQTLQKEGFLFTNMAEQGDTQAARGKLFALNCSVAATDPGSDGVPPWASFEEFERDVCSSYWYHPDSQIVAIDTNTGAWVAMSAITVFQGADHAYNLFTGTDVRYRGRKLAQAVKSLALRKAREFGVDTVRTSHNSENTAMIAIDTRLGYIRTPGTLVMEKDLDNV